MNDEPKNFDVPLLGDELSSEIDESAITDKPAASFKITKHSKEAVKKANRTPISSFFSFLGELIKIVCVVLLLRAYVVQASSVDGRSMEPTLHNGDYLIVERLTPSFEHMPDLLRRIVPDSWIPSLERGDVVVLTSPENGNNELVKRIIALPRDHIFFYDGKIYVNGKAVFEPYIRKQVHESDDSVEIRHFDQSDMGGLDYGYKPTQTEFEKAFEDNELHLLGVEVPEGCVFVMGDNRDSGASNDSRAWAKRDLGSNSPGAKVEYADHMWATMRQINGRVVARVWPWPWEDESRPILIK